MSEEDKPTKERLALAMQEAGLPQLFIRRAREGWYDLFESHLDSPHINLLHVLRVVNGTPAAHLLADRVTAGEFDGTAAEAEAWRESNQGQRTGIRLSRLERTR